MPECYVATKRASLATRRHFQEVIQLGPDNIHLFRLAPQTRGAVLGAKVKDAERFGREGDRVADRQPGPREQVFSRSDTDGKTADGVQGLFANRHGRRPDGRVGPGGDGEIVVQEALPRGSGDAAKPSGAGLALALAEQIAGGEDRRLWEGLDQSPNRLKKRRHPFIVGVEKGYKIVSGFGDSTITGRRDALVGLMDDADALVFDPPDYLRAAIGGTVVDDDDLEVLDGLREDRADGPFDRILLVVQRDDHGESRHSRPPGHAAAGRRPYVPIGKAWGHTPPAAPAA